MKIKHSLRLLVVLLSLSSFAQNGGLLKKKQDQIKALKIAFITDALSLTPDESAKFWPLYNVYQDKQQEIKRSRMKGSFKRMDEESFDKLTEKEATILLAQMESYEDDLYQLKKKFITSLKNILSPVKILKFKKAEDNFNKKLLQQFRNYTKDK